MKIHDFLFVLLLPFLAIKAASSSESLESNKENSSALYFTAETNSGSNATTTQDKNNLKNNAIVYQKLFSHQRGLQKEAINSLLKMNAVNQYKFVKNTMEGIFKVLDGARTNVTKWGHLPEDPFPLNETVRNSVSKILENTALFGDLMLKLPEISHELYDRQNVWKSMVEWCIYFCRKSEMYDKIHLKLLDTLSQELELVPRDPNYLNPYRKVFKESSKDEIPKQKIKIKKKGPKLSQA